VVFCEHQTIEDIDKVEKRVTHCSVSFNPNLPIVDRNHEGKVYGNHEDGESLHNVDSSAETGEIAEQEQLILPQIRKSEREHKSF